MSDKLPLLYDEHSEKAVLGLMIESPAETIPIVTAAEALCRSDFFVPQHKEIFNLLSGMFRDGEPIGMMELHQKIEALGRADELGSPGIIGSCVALAVQANLKRYVDRILRDSRRRQVIRDAETAIRDAYEQPEKLNLNRPSLLPEADDACAITLAELPPDPPYLVEGIFHKGEKMVLAGASKAGKTWSLIDLALSIASGRPWWGFPTNACKVLYVNFEIQPEFFRKRVAIIKNRRGIELEPGALQMLHLRGIKLTASAFCAAIVSRYEREGLGLIVLDPIYKLMVGQDENSTATLSALADVIDGITKSCGCAVAYGAHFSKGNQAGKDSIDRINGSGVTARDADAILTLTKHQEDDCNVLEATLRNSPPIESKVLRWEFPLLIEDKNLDPADLKKIGGRPEEVSKDELLDLVSKPISHKDWLEAAESIGCSKATFNRKIKSLSQKGLIIQQAGSKLYIKKLVSKP